jgi:prevent-host-death family protein
MSMNKWIRLSDPGAIRDVVFIAALLRRDYLLAVSSVTAKQLREETSAILDQVEQGESLIITRNGRAIGKLQPVGSSPEPGWEDLMGEVWRAQKDVKKSEFVQNPVLEERRRRRR